MPRIITKELALRIADKLEAVVETSGGAHDIAFIYHEKKLVASFGIRRGSNRQAGHDHIARELHVGPHDARLLAQCPLTRDGWIKKLQDKRIIEKPQ